MIQSLKIKIAAHTVNAGGVIAYPTEAVFGLGCNPLDPLAVSRILEIKKRPWEKGLILIASDFEQLNDYLMPVSDELAQTAFAYWPGPYTWVWPTQTWVPRWLRGQHDSIAVRISNHPIVCALCNKLGHALVSTSANPASKQPAKSPLKVRQYFPDSIDYLLTGPTGNSSKPSTIRDLLSGKNLRSG